MGRKRNVAGADEKNLPEQLINREQLRRIVPVSDSTVNRWMACGRFPLPIGRTRGKGSRKLWKRSDVERWREVMEV